MTGDDVLPPQIWAVAADGDDFEPLGIDKALLERANSKRPPKLIRPMRCAKYVARRAMEVGYWESMRARREQPGPIAKDFDNLETLAGNAASAMDKFIKHLEPRAAMATDLEVSILTAQAGLQEGSPQGLHLQAEKEAAILWAAREILQRLEAEASRKEARVRKGRQNPGKPDHAAFLRMLAGAWVYLTGCKPGSNTDPLMNPFLRFSALAWADIFDPAPEFTGALRQLPKWGKGQISLLVSQGPSWL
ncbi:MAG: hypothetical protein CR217_10250 [Beijerinckiaceae bacterium]|nr:MAG: hypothetical protein CR217_10250 [Beijerinckiaceae bacterium]